MPRYAGIFMIILTAGLIRAVRPAASTPLTFRLVDTGQVHCFDDSSEIDCPTPGQPFYGQDAQYRGNTAAYRDNGDGTVSDMVTGLMWSKALGTKKMSLAQAQAAACRMTLGGHKDWRVPTIKELYSLVDFRGYTGFASTGSYKVIPANAVPFIDTDYFDFAYGDVNGTERYIDAQWLSCTQYTGTTMDGMDTLFGVNFADGRIKGYGYRRHGTQKVVKTFYTRFVRGRAYGTNDLFNNGDGTVTDRSTGLMWMQADSGRGMAWQEALAYAEASTLAGYHDWRLPNAKELQSIVDYSRSPEATGSAAIEPVFRTTPIVNETGQKDFPYFWTSTTHRDGPRPGNMAVYIAFGRSIGAMGDKVMDIHGAGAQRSDPKQGHSELGHGPQGDARRVKNFVRCVRGDAGIADRPPPAKDPQRYPYKIRLSASLPGIRNRGPGPEGMPRLQETGPHPGVPGRRPGFIERLDRDGDGRVSRAEFDGPPDRFDDHDMNHDGFLSEQEAPKGPPPIITPRRYWSYWFSR